MKKSKHFKDVYEAPRHSIPTRGFIVNQTNIGNIQRQEVVSMLPVLLMKLSNNFSVLDMCAAPGSKTKQLLECSRLVVCNEISYKRLKILISETSKIPSKNFLVLKHDASLLPVFKNDFDRVLCDVPCSGDGTARKNYEVIPKWSIDNALSLCELQYKILKQATCFINDVYSKKAVLELDLEIVDLRENVDDRISKEFRFREGFRRWKTMKINNEEIREYKGIKLESVDEDIGLEKCVRVFPHDQNTGGFFITGLRKRKMSQSLHENIELNKENISNNIQVDVNVEDENYYNIEKSIKDLQINKDIVTNLLTFDDRDTDLQINVDRVTDLSINKDRIKNLQINKDKTKKDTVDFHVVSNELKESLFSQYNITNINDFILIQKHDNSKFIYEVSKEVLEILKSKSLNVAFHGYKMFEKCSFSKSGYFLKTVPKEFKHDIVLRGSLLVEGIKNKTVSMPFKVGCVIILLYDYNIKVSGYSHGEYISINIENKLQRALRDFLR
ncbi:NOL1/NOP2/sun family protein [Vairimorpha necatrix]